MPKDIESTITYKVINKQDKVLLKHWGIRDGCGSAMFLCRQVKIGGEVIDELPVAMFSLDSDARLFTEFLEEKP